MLILTITVIVNIFPLNAKPTIYLIKKIDEYIETNSNHNNETNNNRESGKRRLEITDVCNTSDWPDIKNGYAGVCAECKVLVNKMKSKYITCNNYCNRLGWNCSGAWDESGNTCNVKSTKTCAYKFTKTTDAICECGSTTSIMPSVCNISDWPDIKNGYAGICAECKVLVNKMKSKYITCNNYCNRLGRNCFGAWDESSNTCKVKSRKTCAYKFTYTTDAICECGSASSVMPSGNELKVIGAVGEGRRIKKATRKFTGIVVNIMDRRLCCQQCREKSPDSQMFTFRPQFSYCWCYKTKPGVQPVTESVPNYFSSVCGHILKEDKIISSPLNPKTIATKITGFSQFAHDGLEEHNILRQTTPHNARKLSLDHHLCRDAQEYADYMSKTDMFHHDPGAPHKGQGENLYYSFSNRPRSPPTAKEAILGFYNEKKNCQQCQGHYTQVVWKASLKFCMAVARQVSRSHKWYIVARYFPHGNAHGYEEENVYPGYRRPQYYLDDDGRIQGTCESMGY